MLVLLFGRLEILRTMVTQRAGVVLGQLALAGLEVSADGADIALLLFDNGGHDLFKVLRTVVAQRAGEALGQLALVEVAADLADIACFLLGSGILLGLDVCVVVCVGAGLFLRQHLCLNDICDKQHLRLDILDIDHFTGQDCVGVPGNIADAVCGALVVLAVCELVDITPRLEAEVLEQAVGRFLGEDGDVEFAGLHDHVAGVVFLDDGDGYLLRVAGGDLTSGIYDAAVVNAVNTGGEHLNAIVELRENCVVDRQRIGGLDRLKCGDNGIDIGGDGIGECVKLGKLSVCDIGLERDRFADKLRTLEAGQRLFDKAARGGSPRAVFEYGDLAVAQIVVCDIVHEVFHRDENAGVVGGGGEHHVAVLECVRENVRCRGDGGVEHLGLEPALSKLAGEDVHGVLGVTVHGGVCDHDTVFLGSVGAPLEILVEKIAEVAAPDKAVQRADIVKLESGGLFEHCLHLSAVFADDVCVVTASLVKVIRKEIDLVVEQVTVECAEGAEGIGGKQHLVGQVIGHHDLRPVHHGRHDEGEIMLAGRKRVALLHDVVLERVRQAEKLTEHGLYPVVAYDGDIGVAQRKLVNGGGVIRLHV